jgi:hypothetical protein
MAKVLVDATPHCSSCGALNPEHVEGYTDCCGKRVCYGWAKSSYGAQGTTPCCVAAADGYVR